MRWLVKLKFQSASVGNIKPEILSSCRSITSNFIVKSNCTTWAAYACASLVIIYKESLKLPHILLKRQFNCRGDS